MLPFLIAYLFGCLPIGYAIGCWRGIDITKEGSGNTGATNIWRTLGPVWGSLVFILDALKGGIPVEIARHLLTVPEPMIIYVASTAVLGHMFSLPLFIMKRKSGGKGVATIFGAIVCCYPSVALASIAIWGVVVLISRMVSLASIVAVWTGPLFSYWFGYSLVSTEILIVLACVITLLHRGNIKKIVQGTESRLWSTTKD